MRFTVFIADCAGNEKNAVYPHKRAIKNSRMLQEAAAFDHVAASFASNYRSKENFLSADVAVMDCDNAHSDSPEEWVTGEALLAMIPRVSVAIAPSRNDGKMKGGKAARPRFHAYFPIGCINDADAYAKIKRAIQQKFPFFDGAALDAARFLYGSSAENVLWQEGALTIDKFLAEQLATSHTIPQGQRNNTMSRFAGRVIKRYGAAPKAYQIFLDEAEKCDPPLADEELNKIWMSAVRFGKKISEQADYIAPDKYNNDFGTRQSLRPEDFSDIGQGKVLVREFGKELRYTDATDYLRYDGIRWVESRQRAVGAMEEFLDLQLADAKDACAAATKMLEDANVPKDAIRQGGKTLEKFIVGSLVSAHDKLRVATAYLNFVMKRRDMKYVLSALTAAKPMLAMEFDDLDKDPFLLNCPDGTYDLRQGMAERREHRWDDFITKVTETAPGDEGKELWQEMLSRTFLGDQELIDYVQMIAGLAAVGSVALEALIIAYGDGANGKSTLWNAIAGVLGNYSGTISADALTASCKRNVRPELAEIKGKRLLIAAELEEGMRLSTSVVKQLCSTDRITAEKKYKAPSSFTPSHTLVLYTNHLPRVGALDTGIWRRLIVIPFLASIDKQKDIKNYAKYLLDHASPYILKWVMEGAAKAIRQNFAFEQPFCVKEAIRKYRAENDWLGHFLEVCCELSDERHEKAGRLYEEYRSYCLRMGEFLRNSIEFSAAMEQRGFQKVRRRDGRYFFGVALKTTDFAE